MGARAGDEWRKDRSNSFHFNNIRKHIHTHLHRDHVKYEKRCRRSERAHITETVRAVAAAVAILISERKHVKQVAVVSWSQRRCLGTSVTPLTQIEATGLNSHAHTHRYIIGSKTLVFPSTRSTAITVLATATVATTFFSSTYYGLLYTLRYSVKRTINYKKERVTNDSGKSWKLRVGRYGWPTASSL